MITLLLLALQNDFEPPRGKIEGPAREGPWNSRLLLATSRDGLSFSGATLVSDQASAPGMVMGPDGRIFLYYVGWTVGRDRNKTVAAVSDDGRSWTYRRLQLTGFDRMGEPGDPDVMLLDDGTFRMYLTSDRGQGHGIFRAEGKDGLRFANCGSAFPDAIDSATAKIGDHWHLFALAGEHQRLELRHGTSGDGLAFASAQGQPFGENCVPSHTIRAGEGWRTYAFTLGRNAAIVSFFTKDGKAWTREEGARLKLGDARDRYVRDPTVVRLKDGTYLMAYTTGIP